MTAHEIPLFIPASAGPIFGIVSLPGSDLPLREPGVVLLPGGRAGAGVLPLFQSVARRLAEGGQPVVRFDYPGSGLSSTTPAVAHSELRAIVHEVSDWFAGETAIGTLAVAGRCGGGRLALAMPSVDARFTVSVAAVPFFAMGGWSLRSKLADLDARGPRLASRLIRAPRPGRSEAARRDPDELAAEFAEDLATAVRDARTTVVFGEDDPLLQQFHEVVQSRGLGGALESLDLVVLPGARLHGLPNVDHERLLGELLVSRLGASEVTHA